jgi:hypothetical protein
LPERVVEKVIVWLVAPWSLYPPLIIKEILLSDLELGIMKMA